MSFGKFLALSLFSILLTVNLLFIFPVFAQEEYFFQEEFNQERAAGILDSDKWIVYPNQPTQPTSQGCLVETIKETGGILLLKQCPTITQFPYVVSKNNPIPNGDFTASVRFQFTGAGGLPTGIKFVDTAPENGQPATEIFGIGFEQDVFQKFVIEYDDTVVFTKNTDSGFYVFKAVKEGNIYKLFLNDQLVFTSPETSEKVKAIYMGNPAILQSPGYNWSWPRIDYIRVVDDGPSQVAPEPFLDLPWDYDGDGMSFNEAATSINSFFDHEYPLLSAGMQEPSNVVSFRGGESNPELDYSSHDGYDYGTPAEVNFGKPLLAAAAGTATYMSSCSACGNAILIDHGNGYQTRYYHLQKDGLVVNQPGESVEVTQGEEIGKVGFSGNVSPSGESGSHLHFMVVQDKNNDGSFSDNIPDGITDPFGWQSEDPDPWEDYTFEQGEEEKTGNISYYLFTNQLDNLNESLTSNAKVFEVGKTKLEFPEGATNQNLNLSIKSAPNFLDLNGLRSLGSLVVVEAKNQAGQQITNFAKNFGLTINFSQFDLTHLNTNTLSIYSSPDGQNWTKETTQVDLNSKTATTSISHLTYFALMAERKDTVAPTTSANLQGQKGTANNFRSDVTLSLDAQDNEGGLGIEFTAYSIGEAEWQTYKDPLVFTDEGNHKVYFYSEDKDGNIEEVKTVEFSIDKTIPEAKIFVNLSDYQLKILPEPENSGIISKKAGKKKDESIYTIQDPAGNTLNLESKVTEKDRSSSFELYTIQYNSDKAVIMPKNSLDTSFILQPNPGSDPTLRKVNQTFEYDQEKFIIFADALKNKTDINFFSSRSREKQEKEGIILIQLKTNKGKLEYSY